MKSGVSVAPFAMDKSPPKGRRVYILAVPSQKEVEEVLKKAAHTDLCGAFFAVAQKIKCIGPWRAHPVQSDV